MYLKLWYTSLNTPVSPCNPTPPRLDLENTLKMCATHRTRCLFKRNYWVKNFKMHWITSSPTKQHQEKQHQEGKQILKTNKNFHILPKVLFNWVKEKKNCIGFYSTSAISFFFFSSKECFISIWERPVINRIIANVRVEHLPLLWHLMLEIHF